jgi:hypothetical protein
MKVKIERGVMVMKDGKAWGVLYEDGHSTLYGWMDPESAPIHDPRYLEKPEGITWSGSSDIHELRTGKLVQVERQTIVLFDKPCDAKVSFHDTRD